ncbi:MAG: lysylphosphatidylglycerol synthase transmembrane domain-containing protein [Anaerolineae bacterium]|jgi:hypothetical protein
MSGVASSAPPERLPSLRKRLASGRTIASFVIAFGLIAFFLSRQDRETLVATWGLIKNANPALYIAALAAYYLAFPIRGVRWGVLLQNSGESKDRIPGLADLSEIIYLSWFANSVVPAKLGDVYRGFLLRKSSGITWSHGMGTIVAERTLDAIVLVVLMICAGLLTYGEVLGSAVAGGPAACVSESLVPTDPSCFLLEVFVVGAVLAVGLVVGLVVFARFGTHLERFLPERIGDIYERFAGALVLSFDRFPQLLGLSALAWAAEGSAFWLVGEALGFHLPLALVVFFALLQAFLTVIPLTPGGLGFEWLLAGALSLKGYDPAAALAMTGLYRTISYGSLIVGGAVVFALSDKTK